MSYHTEQVGLVYKEHNNIGINNFKFPFNRAKKSLKIPKGQSESVYRRKDKHIYNTRDRITRTPLKTGVNSGAPEG